MPYRPWQVALAILLAGVFGWLVLALYNTVLIWPDTRTDPFAWGRFKGQLWLFVVLGLPTAILISGIALSVPIARLMRKPVAPQRAVKWGLSLSLVLAVVSIVVGRTLGLVQYLNPNSWRQLGRDDYVRSVDGILTVNGWIIVGRNTPVWVAGCTLSALIIQQIIGPGRALGAS